MTEYRYKWVSLRLCGEDDPKPAIKAKAAGWEPVPVAEIPSGIFPPSITKPETFGLYRMPEEAAQQRAAHIEQTNKEELNSAERRYLRDQDHHAPKFSVVMETYHVPNEHGWGPLRLSLEEWFSPRNLELYPDRKTELDTVTARASKYANDPIRLVCAKNIEAAERRRAD